MVSHPVPSCLFPSGARFSIVAIWIYGKAASRQEPAPYLNILRIKQPDQILQDGIDNILMEVAVIPEREQVQLQ